MSEEKQLTACAAFEQPNGFCNVTDYIHKGGDTLGVLVGTIFAIIAFFVSEARKRRLVVKEQKTRKLELMRTLFAEVLDTYTQSLEHYDETLIKEWKSGSDADGAYFPYAPAVPSNFIFDVIKQNLHYFEHDLQIAVTRYYYHDLIVEKMFRDFSEVSFRALPKYKKLEIFSCVTYQLDQYKASAHELLGLLRPQIYKFQSQLGEELISLPEIPAFLPPTEAQPKPAE